MRSKNKHIYFSALLVLCCYACRKVTLTSTGKASNMFAAEGRAFVFPCTLFSGRPVLVNIPPNAVNTSSYLEYYQFRLSDSSSVDSFYVDGAMADINLFVSDGKTLEVPAVMRIPFYFGNVYTPASGYKPYRVHAESYKDILKVLNNTANWEPVDDFTYDNTSKYMVLNTTNLDGIYVVAKMK